MGRADDHPTAPDDPSDAAALADHAAALLAVAADVVGPWIERAVVVRAAEAEGLDPSEVAEAAAAAARRAADEAVADLRALLTADVDDQDRNPLAILRAVTVHATSALDGLGVVPGARDAFAREAFPDDAYGLTPMTWSDIDDRLHDPGIRWGAAKAFVVTSRRRREGRR